MTTKTAYVYGHHGYGPTMKDAKENAIERIEALSEGYWTPSIIVWRGATALVYRDIAGWNYVLTDACRHQNGEHTPCVHFVGTRDRANHAARRHLAQNGFNAETDSATLPDVLAPNSAADKDEFLRWARWQLDFRRLRLEGKSVEECHALASSH